ncbi:glycosyltransferase family 2 protein [Sporomusa sp.]|uniref:glycosyltransferase family 2 protein n=1 Tax=Sporomusa sp. TaxID=2078658 RepID=UPI002C912EF9|nr:glycosyltransferase family 2 protein [Sporomusa sp.]HWR44301.1 glycosyltransferase family 2 protein [Sporomusa sp.]
MNDLVSIVMPAYNVQNYIGKSIESILLQGYKNWELILIDDGSSDETLKVVESFACDDNRIHIYRQLNSGVSKTRNRGLDLAKGRYIAFLDGDDFWESSFLEEMIARIDQSRAPMVYCGCVSLYRNGSKKLHSKRFSYAKGNILPDVLLGRVSIANGAALFIKDFLIDNNLKFAEGCRSGEDFEFYIRVICLTHVDVVEKDLMVYVQRSNSACNLPWNWNLIDKYYSLQRVKYFITGNYNKNDKQIVMHALDLQTGQWIYRFLWKAIKYGYKKEVIELLKDELWYNPLKQISLEESRYKDKLKIKIILSKNERIWSLISCFR